MGGKKRGWRASLWGKWRKGGDPATNLPKIDTYKVDDHIDDVDDHDDHDVMVSQFGRGKKGGESEQETPLLISPKYAEQPKVSGEL